MIIPDKNIVHIQKDIFNAMEEMPVIDSHEHLGPEEERTSMTVDIFSLFIVDKVYMDGDLRLAGMSKDEYFLLYNMKLPLEYRWSLFKPYWEKVRYTTTGKIILLAIKKFYSFEDLNNETYQLISLAMQAENKPGLYERVLKEACGIRASITQCGTTKTGSNLLRPVVPVVFACEQKTTWGTLINPRAENLGGMRGHEEGWTRNWPVFKKGTEINTLDDYMNAVEDYIIRSKAEGAVGIKMYALLNNLPSRSEAAAAFEKLRNGTIPYLEEYSSNPLRDYVWDRVISVASERGLVIDVHCGFGGDFRYLNPTHLVPVLKRHPEARFDVYHLGYPWVNETVMLAKCFPNVWLNLCGIHATSQNLTANTLCEAVDMLPVNKIISFGADYYIGVEKVYGHFIVAKENVSRVLACIVADGRISTTQAVSIAKAWFYENPRELYELEV